MVKSRTAEHEMHPPETARGQAVAAQRQAPVGM